MPVEPVPNIVSGSPTSEMPEASASVPPLLIRGWKEYNIVSHRGQFSAIPRAAGPLDLTERDPHTVPGAIVLLKNGKTLQVRSYVAQSDGAYHFYGLSTDVNWQLRAVWSRMTGSSRSCIACQAPAA